MGGHSVSNMKRMGLFVLIILITVALLTGCGSSASQNKEGNGKETTAGAIKGENVETDHFTMIVATGYNLMNISGGIQAYQGSNAIEVWVRPSTQDAKAVAEKFAADYGGTSPEQVELAGRSFYATSFTASGYEQTKYIAISDGNRIEIGLTGSGHKDNKDLQGMLNSIKLK